MYKINHELLTTRRVRIEPTQNLADKNNIQLVFVLSSANTVVTWQFLSQFILPNNNNLQLPTLKYKITQFMKIYIPQVANSWSRELHGVRNSNLNPCSKRSLVGLKLNVWALQYNMVIEMLGTYCYGMPSSRGKYLSPECSRQALLIRTGKNVCTVTLHYIDFTWTGGYKTRLRAGRDPRILEFFHI